MPVIGLPVVPRLAAEVGPENFFRAVTLAIPGDPIGRRRANRSSLEPLRMTHNPDAEESAIAPAHDSQAARIRDALRDELIDPGHYIVHVAETLRLDVSKT